MIANKKRLAKILERLFHTTTHQESINERFSRKFELEIIGSQLIKHNFYIITGGPGGGKTSLLENLVVQGYDFVPETARQIIKDRLSKGLSPRPDPTTFAQDIFTKDWDNFISNANRSSVLFFDRSFVDSAWMINESDKASYHIIAKEQLRNRYNNKVFVTPPWKEIYRNDEERDQTFEEAIEVFSRLENWYRIHNYDIIVLPKVSVDERAKFILDQISADQSRQPPGTA